MERQPIATMVCVEAAACGVIVAVMGRMSVDNVRIKLQTTVIMVFAASAACVAVALVMGKRSAEDA